MPQIKVVEDDDTFFFGPNAVLFIQHGNKQIQITFNDEGGANIVQFEPHGGKVKAGIAEAPTCLARYEGIVIAQ